jgi:glutathione S-transferase kappa 1
VPVDFFFDVLSPYSYFAFESLCRYRGVWGLQLRLRPVFQSALIQATGNSPPALNAAKAPYLSHDIRRLAIYFSVPLGEFPPSRMPAVLHGTLPVQRMLVALQSLHGDAALESVARLLWQRYLLTDEDILSAESKLAVLQQAAGLTLEQAQAVLTAANEPAAKKALADNTAAALAHGAFGVPTITFPLTDAEARAREGGASTAMIFGSDRFHIMAQLLNKTWVGPKPPVVAPVVEKKRRIMSRL